MSEETAPYGTGPAAGRPEVGEADPHPPPAGDEGARREVHDAHRLRACTPPQTFDEAGIDVLLVGDSASNNVYGNETSLPVTVDELLPLTRAVAAAYAARSSSATCRSAPTRPRPSRATSPPSAS